MGSRVPEVIDRLVQLGEADTGLKDVRIADGPEVTADADMDWLIVGFDGDPNGDFQAAQSVGGWSDLRTGRDEQFRITVAAISQRGDTDVRAARARAYEIAARVEAWTRTDPTLGLRSLEAGVEATQLTQDQTQQGVQAVLLLTVAGSAFT
ncbi:hypothetical protein ACFVAF_36855 [Streptomyces sp. NPDC057596]|uniref:hypothetical protein n=1 Tax=Streptomyces sp. NPDC057596 TaxID=3346178 RepID=UPI0036830789